MRGPGSTLESALASLTMKVRGAVTAVSVAWPLIFLTPVLALVLLNTQQGRQGLNAVLTGTYAPYWMTFLAIGAHSLSVYGEFLRATRRRMELFGHAIRLQRFNRFVAMVLSLILPVSVSVYIHYLIGGSTSDSSPIEREALTTSLVVLGTAFVVNYYLGRRFFAIRETAYNQIGLIGRRYVWMLRALLVVSGVVGVSTAFIPVARETVGPAAILILALTLMAVVLTYFVGFIHDRRLPPLPVWIVAVAIFGAVVSLFFGSSYHNVRLVKSAQPGVITPSREFAEDWIRSRLAADPESEAPIPAILVFAEGGGIYAARNAAGLLVELDRRSDDAFYDNVYSFSGVSGGSIGLSAYLSARAEALSRDEAGADAMHEMLGKDYVSPLAAGLFFRDLPMRITPLALVADVIGLKNFDRASIFERDFSRHWLAACARLKGEACTDWFARPFLEVVSSAASRRAPCAQGTGRGDSAPCDPGPLVMFNTVKVESGRVEVISNIAFDAHGEISDHSLENPIRAQSNDRTFSLAGAAHMSARFPMISPTAMIPGAQKLSFIDRVKILLGIEVEQMDGRKRYVDGGYVDNSGALSSIRALDELVAAARAIDEDMGCAVARCVSSRIRPIVLHIYLRRVGENEIDGGQKAGTNWFEELVNPLEAVLKVRSARGGSALESFCRTLAFFAEADPETSCEKIEKNEQRIDQRGQETATPSFGGRTRHSGSSAEASAETYDSRRAVWIAAPLDVSSDPRESGYVPLGWYLGGTNEYIKERHAEDIPKICKVMSIAVEAAASWNCR